MEDVGPLPLTYVLLVASVLPPTSSPPGRAMVQRELDAYLPPVEQQRPQQPLQQKPLLEHLHHASNLCLFLCCDP